jgi:RNA polymerase sigma factor (sigma-70 family)
VRPHERVQLTWEGIVDHIVEVAGVDEFKLITDHMGLAHSVAKKYVALGMKYGYAYEDLVQIGLVGLIKAAKKAVSGEFDPTRVKFSTYAYKAIWNEIMCELDSARRFKRYVDIARMHGYPPILTQQPEPVSTIGESQ